MNKDRNNMRSYRASGFSLIELMVVFAIIGILATIALPAYNDYVRKTRRTAGAACAAAVAQQMERYYTTALTYVGAPPAGIMSARCEPAALEFYSIGTGNPTAKAYTVTATPQGGHSDPTCGTLSINQVGVKSPTTAGCW